MARFRSRPRGTLAWYRRVAPEHGRVRRAAQGGSGQRSPGHSEGCGAPRLDGMGHVSLAGLIFHVACTRMRSRGGFRRGFPGAGAARGVGLAFAVAFAALG